MAKKGSTRKEKKATSSTARNGQDALYTLPAVSNKLFLLLTQAIGACVGAVYATILIKVNEQRYWWSEINEARKEVIFHSEQAMYYRYFKDVTDTSLPISQVFYNFLNDATVESPNVINALKRFNVWPEFLLGVSFRYFSTSEPIDYYVHTVLAWSFFLMAGIYVTATLITRNLICGLVAVAAVMGNFLDSTRVWGSVPLRESWSIPLIFSQIAVVTYVLHMSSSGQMTASESRMKRFAPFVLLYVLTTSLVLSWQLAASIMALQVAALFLTHLLGYINTQLLKHLIVCHLMSVSSVVVFMFGNEMLITSPYTITCIGALVAVMGCDCLLGSADALQFPYRLTRSFVVGMCSIAIAIATKVALHTLPFLPAGDDAHMYNLIQAKVGDFEDFHTNLYLHSEAFQMLQWHTIMRLTYTGILPMAVTGVLLVSGYILRDICTGRHSKVMYTELETARNAAKPDTKINKGKSGRKSPTPQSPHTEESPQLQGELVFNALFFLCMSLTAALFQRLRFLWVPYMGIMAVVLCAREITVADSLLVAITPGNNSHSIRIPIVLRQLLLALGVSSVTWYGSNNWSEVRHRLQTEEQYQLPEMNKLVDWIKENTPEDAVITGDMSTMGSVRLMANRTTANHPHYEDQAIRHKTYKIAHWFGWRPVQEVHAILSGYGITHVVNHLPPCNYALTKKGTGYADFVEMGEDGSAPSPATRTKQKCCQAVADPAARKGYFELVRDTKDWPVYKVLPRK